MNIEDWKYYNNAIIPTVAPHRCPDMTPLLNDKVWGIAKRGYPFFARWVTEFDCTYRTEWWYCIKDTPFSLAELNSKKRYEINKGKKHFIVRTIDASKYIEDIIRIKKKVWTSYPQYYRPVFDEDESRKDIQQWGKYKVFGAFSIVDGNLRGYAVLEEFENYVDFKILKSEQEYERMAINATIVAKICECYSDRLSEKFYISDGERNVIHETAFQDYLVKYFGFRKAYCKLNIKYRRPIGLIVKCLYPIQKIVALFRKNRFLNKVNALLVMEKYRRLCDKIYIEKTRV